MLVPSDEQQRIIDTIKNGNNVSVDAVAGSGKTTTVLSLAHLNGSLNIKQLTYNSELKREVKSKIEKYKSIMNLDKITVDTYHSFAHRYYSSEASTDLGICRIVDNNMPPKIPLPEIDLLVIDEVQDMMRLYYTFVYKFVFDLGRKIQILILGDKNQGLYEFKGSDTRFLTLGYKLWSISQFEFKNLELTTSYRMTNQIADFVNKVMIGNDRIKAVKDGPPVLYIRNTNSVNACKMVFSRIVEFLETGYATPEDIFVLTPSLKKASDYKLLENMLVSKNIPCYVPISDDSSITDNVVKNKIVFSTFHQSKGRERKICIIFQFDINYFMYYNRCKLQERFTCPSALYVAATRATDNLIVVELSEPLPFLKYSHTQIKNSTFASFPGIPLGNMNVDSNKILHQEYELTSPTEMIKFIQNETLVEVSELMDKIFIQKYEPLHPVKLSGYSTSLYNGFNICEEVMDINGTTIPALYQEKTTGENTIKKFVKDNINKYKYKDKLLDVNFTETTISQSLLITNIYNSMTNKLLFKVKQITTYDWLTADNVDNMICNIDRHITHPEELKYEMEISNSSMFNTRYDKMDAFIRVHCSNARISKLRFNAIVDAVSTTTVWEFKCVESLTIEHKLQLLIYAWIWKMLDLGEREFTLMNVRTSEVYTLDLTTDVIDEIMIKIIESKYERVRRLNDCEFIKSCNDSVSLYASFEDSDDYDLY
jgi:hypothetical protein